MGSSVGLTRQEFPLPCSFSDIRETISRGRVRSVLIIIDSDAESWERFWRVWNEIIIGVQIFILCSENIKPSVESYIHKSKVELVCLEVGANQEERIFSNGVADALQGLPSQDLILSISPYDSYGEHIKTELEKALLPFLKKWDSLFLLHDPSYQVIRVADFQILKDRIYCRPWRINIYARLLRVFFWFCPLFFRNKQEDWIRVK